jgi:prenyltransferase beta subunit
MLTDLEREERIARGLNFINENGSDDTRAFALAIVNPDTVDEALKKLQPFQNTDGGWRGMDSDMKGPISTISCTWVAMQRLSWLEQKDAECLMRTVDFIKKVQNENGSWDESEEILKYDPPPWYVPGVYENQIWLTSAICCQLMEINKTSEVNFKAAIEFLRGGMER